MDEKRRNEIAYQMEKLNTRISFSFRDFANAKRRIGNLVQEPEMVAANVTKEELLEYGKFLIIEVFEEQIEQMNST